MNICRYETWLKNQQVLKAIGKSLGSQGSTVNLCSAGFQRLNFHEVYDPEYGKKPKQIVTEYLNKYYSDDDWQFVYVVWRSRVSEGDYFIEIWYHE